MKAQHIKIKCNRSSFSSEAVANFSSGSCLKQQWQHRGDLPVATALQLPWGMYPGGTAAPTERLCLEEFCYWIKSCEPHLELGWRALTFVLISQHHFSVVKSIHVTCRLGRSTFHHASSLLVGGEQSRSALLNAQGDLIPVLSTGGQLPQKCWQSCCRGQGRYGFSYKNKNVTNCHNANTNGTIKPQLFLIYAFIQVSHFL